MWMRIYFLTTCFHASEMEEMPFGKGFIRGTIGKGSIRFALPDNPITSILFGKTGAIKITDADLMELKKLLIE